MDAALTRQQSWFRRGDNKGKREVKDLARPGWFPDPAEGSCERFWTGTIWTGLTRPIAESYSLPIMGLSRTFFDHSIQTNSVRTRRLVASEDLLRWGRFNLRLSEVSSVSHWMDRDSKDGHWNKLNFQAVGRLGTLRVEIHGVRGEAARGRAYDGYRALVSTATSIVVPRLAVEIVDRLEAGQVVKMGSMRLTARGLSSRSRDPRRHGLSGRWDTLQLMVDPTGKPLLTETELVHRGTALIRTADGLAFPALDPHDRTAAVLPLVLWLAQDRFVDRAQLASTQLRAFSRV
jgi:Protein of unknown function (DUF2510)